MRVSIIVLGLLSSFAIAAPINARQDNRKVTFIYDPSAGNDGLTQGSTSSNKNSASAESAATDGHSTSAQGSSACSLISCASEGASAGPDGAASSSSSSGGLTIEPTVDTPITV